MTNNSLTHIRKLTISLILSGALNLALVCLFFYGIVKDHPPPPYYELKPANQQELQNPLAIDHSNDEIILDFRKKHFEWLVARLTNSELAKNGYTQRDLALACLVAFHHFDIERAHPGLSFSDRKHTLIYGKYPNGQSAKLHVYRGLTDRDFNMLLSFAQTERWPFNSKGLYSILQNDPKNVCDQTLTDAFFMTPEFLSVELLFERAHLEVNRFELLEVLLQGDWTLLSSFAEQQKSSQDLSSTRRQRFLLDFVEKRSKAAAHLLLKTDKELVMCTLKEDPAGLLSDLLKERLPAEKKLQQPNLLQPTSLFKALTSQHDKQKKPLFHPVSSIPTPEYSSKDAPSDSALTYRSLPNKPALISSIPHKSAPALKTVERLYIVQEGDSLWKIAKQFNVDIRALKSHNNLDTDTLSLGKTLRIPK